MRILDSLAKVLPGVLPGLLLPGLLASLFVGLPAQAAERVILDLAGLDLEISMAELEDFVYRNQTPSTLVFYTSFLDQQTVDRTKQLLAQKYALSANEITPVLQAPLIQDVFTWLGQMITTETGANGSDAIQTALLNAGQTNAEIDLLTVMRAFPDDTLRIDADRILDVLDQVGQLRQKTKAVVELMRSTPATATEFDYSRDLRQAGPFQFQQETLDITDPNRQRTLVVDLYAPTDAALTEIPVVVISHGLGSSRQYYQYVAEHLASHGFAVAALTHPGSDAERLVSLITGMRDTVFDTSEFSDRPQDVSVVLDYLEQENAAQFGGRFDVQNAGIFGNSFGGYTALAVAGAQIDRANLEQDCAQQLNSINLSLLLQCNALEMPIDAPTTFRDDRIKAALTINPVNSSIFGPVGMRNVAIPVILAASADDIVTPALLEQVRSFTWISSDDRYLTLVEDASHVIGESDGSGVQDLIRRLVSPAPTALVNYDKFLALSFFGAYLQDDDSLLVYLQGPYAQQINEPPFNLYVVDARSLNQVQQALNSSE